MSNNSNVTDSTASISSILDVINRVNESFVYGVWVPSLKREVSFRELNTAQQKRIIKSIVDSPVYNSQFIVTLYQIIKENCAENIDIDQLTIVDKLFIGLKIRSASVSDTWEIEFDKSNKRGFSLEKIIEQGKTLNLTNKEITEGSYVVNCRIPTIEVEYLTEKELRGDVDKKIDDLNLKTTREFQAIIGDVFSNEIVKHIEKITIIKDASEKIEICFDNKISYSNKLAIIEKMPAKVIKEIMDYINEQKKELDKVVLFKTTIVKDGKEEVLEERLTLDGRFFIKS